MVSCCFPLESVDIGPPGNFSGVYGLSDVFVKSHLIFSLGNGSPPAAVRLAFIPTILTQISVRHQTDSSFLLRQLFAWMKRQSRSSSRNFISVPYQKQKSALELQLSQFLDALSPPRTVTLCTANDIVKFLISKDKSGRTVVHSSSCSRASCTSPKRLAAGSVDSLMGRLRAIFNKMGRLTDSIPVAHPLVKHYLKFVRQEQAGLAITPT